MFVNAVVSFHLAKPGSARLTCSSDFLVDFVIGHRYPDHFFWRTGFPTLPAPCVWSSQDYGVCKACFGTLAWRCFFRSLSPTPSLSDYSLWSSPEPIPGHRHAQKEAMTDQHTVSPWQRGQEAQGTHDRIGLESSLLNDHNSWLFSEIHLN